MSSLCKKCDKAVRESSSIRCWGNCKSNFHHTCIDWKFETWMKLFKECPYAKFVCMQCQGQAADDSGQAISSVKALADEMRKSIDTLKETFDSKINGLAELVEKTQLAQAIPPNIPPPIQPLVKDDNPERHVTSIVGTGLPDSSILTVEVLQTKFLHVSHLNPETTAEAVRTYVHKTFGVPSEDIKCWSLIPKNRKIEMMKFISFKVGIPEKVFDSTLTPELWPALTVVRPFIHRQHKKNDLGARF